MNPAIQPEEIEYVPLSRISVDQRFQVRRKGTDLAVVRRYESVVRNGNGLPPITLARIDGVLFCVDGFHRLEAHRRAGAQEIEAHIINASATEAAWLGAASNLTNGVPLKNAETREAFKRFIKARKHLKKSGRFKSYREIAFDFGGNKGHTTLRNWMQRDFPSIARRMGGNEWAGGSTGKELDVTGDLESEAVAAVRRARSYVPGIAVDHRTTLEMEAEGLLADLRAGGSGNAQEIDPF